MLYIRNLWKMQMHAASHDKCWVAYMWYAADVHDAVRHVPYCTTHTACTASVRCFLQRELRNLRADLGQSFWFGEPRTGRLDSCTYE